MSDPIIEIKPNRWEKIRDVCVSIAALSIPILAFSVAMSSRNVGTLTEVANRIEASAECRFDGNAEISDINDWIDYWTAVGLRAIAEENDADLQEALRQIDHYADLFREAVQDRTNIAERCSAIVNPVGSPPSTEG